MKSQSTESAIQKLHGRRGKTLQRRKSPEKLPTTSSCANQTRERTKRRKKLKLTQLKQIFSDKLTEKYLNYSAFSFKNNFSPANAK
jgi:hypothetical protein